jgi:hypothetical protein
MSIIYDYPTLETESDKTIEEIHAFGYRTSVAATPGTYLVELFPWMLHIPERLVLVSTQCIPDSVIGAALASQGGSMKEGNISSNTMPCSRDFLIAFGVTW